MKKYLISIIMVAFSFALLSCGGLNPVKKDGGSPPATPTGPSLEGTLWAEVITSIPVLDTPKKAALSTSMGNEVIVFANGKSCLNPGGEPLASSNYGNPPGTAIPSSKYTISFFKQCGDVETPTKRVSYTLDLHGGSTLAGATGTIGTNTTFTISADGLTMDVLNAGTHFILTKAVPSPPLS